MLLRRALFSPLHLRFQRRFLAETLDNVLATSLRDIARSGARVMELQLRNSNDLVCHQLMCEFVGDACICRLSLALERVPRLQHLDLSHNQLRALPDAVYTLQNLKTLNVQENQLTILSTDVEKLMELEMLDVQYNKFKTLPVKQLETLTKLKTLRVVGNFELIEQLETLKMSKQLKEKIVVELRSDLNAALIHCQLFASSTLSYILTAGAMNAGGPDGGLSNVGAMVEVYKKSAEPENKTHMLNDPGMYSTPTMIAVMRETCCTSRLIGRKHLHNKQTLTSIIQTTDLPSLQVFGTTTTSLVGVGSGCSSITSMTAAVLRDGQAY